MNKADRFNEGKLKWSLVDYKALEPLVRVLEYGANKYSADNWKKGLDKKEILESTMRHLIALISDQPLDDESKLEHEGHVLANMMFYSHFNQKREIDQIKLEGLKSYGKMIMR